MRTSTLIKTLVALSAVALAGTAAAKLPPPSDEAKAKAAETAAKNAHGDKVANYKLCLSMNDVAAKYAAAQKRAGKAVAPTPTPPCADPGPFVYTPPAAAAPATATAAAAPAKPAAPAPAAPAAAAPKKS